MTSTKIVDTTINQSSPVTFVKPELDDFIKNNNECEIDFVHFSKTLRLCTEHIQYRMLNADALTNNNALKNEFLKDVNGIMYIGMPLIYIRTLCSKSKATQQITID